MKTNPKTAAGKTSRIVIVTVKRTGAARRLSLARGTVLPPVTENTRFDLTPLGIAALGKSSGRAESAESAAPVDLFAAGSFSGSLPCGGCGRVCPTWCDPDGDLAGGERGCAECLQEWSDWHRDQSLVCSGAIGRLERAAAGQPLRTAAPVPKEEMAGTAA